MIALIVARAENGVIGLRNDLPWHLPADLKHFKEITGGHTVIMGRKTFESIYKRLKGPLPNRRNIVVTKTLADLPAGFEAFSTLADAVSAAHDQLTFIIGGTSVFKESLDQKLIDEIFLTEVKAMLDGDTYFPTLSDKEWQRVSREGHAADEKNPYAYSFVHLKRKP